MGRIIITLFYEIPGLTWTRPDLYGASAEDERYQPNHQKYEEQNLGNSYRGTGEPAETQNRRNQRNNQKHQ